MGVLSDIFLADLHNVQEVSESLKVGEDASTDDRIDVKGLDGIRLEQLEQFVTGKSFSEPIGANWALVGISSREGPWIWEFPPVFVEGLANQTEQSIPQLAQQWATIEEFQPSKWSSGVSEYDLKELLKQLAALARRSQTEQKKMFLWMSL